MNKYNFEQNTDKNDIQKSMKVNNELVIIPDPWTPCILK